jgi:hypothetical protein
MTSALADTLSPVGGLRAALNAALCDDIRSGSIAPEMRSRVYVRLSLNCGNQSGLAKLTRQSAQVVDSHSLSNGAPNYRFAVVWRIAA